MNLTPKLPLNEVLHVLNAIQSKVQFPILLMAAILGLVQIFLILPK